MKNKQPLLIVMMALILASLACGPVQVGNVPPTFEAIAQPTADVQESQPQLDALNDVESQIVDEPASEPTKVSQEYAIPTMAYIGPDGNLWVLEAGSENPLQVTFDAKRGSQGTTVEYMNPSLSSDGTLLAYSLLVGTPSVNGFDNTFSVWVANWVTGQQNQVLEGRSGGYAWKPGTRTLAYGIGVEMEYFMSGPNPDLATGIYAVDLDSSETHHLVTPERGYALASPNWSPDGRFLAFAEVDNMEGSGLFAYYDLENQEYVAWDESVGRASWSPDGSLLTYARDIYTPTGDERLYLHPRQGDEQLLGPDYTGPAYASQPVFSPAGDQIAYLARLEGPMTGMATILVLDLAGGEPKSLGQFEDVWEFAWVPDGSHVVFSFGLYPSRHIIALNINDGSQTVLAAGDQLTLAGQ